MAPRKMKLAKAKQVVTKNRKAKAKKNMDTFFLKTKNMVIVTPVQGGTVANYIYAQFTLDPTGQNAQMYTGNAEFQLYRLQYDKFRVNSVKVTVTPKANVFDQANNNNDAQLNTLGDGLIHTCLDRNSIAPSSRVVISRYPSYRKYSVLKPFSRSYSIKYPTGVWLDCASPNTFNLATELGLRGGITMYAENILEDNYEVTNEPWATIVVEYNIVFQGKVSNHLVGQYDLSGNLTGVAIQAIKPSDSLALSPLKNIGGTLDQDTRTTSEILEQPVDDLGVNV